jgi:hypothetical protein
MKSKMKNYNLVDKSGAKEIKRPYHGFIKNLRGQTTVMELAIFVICLVIALVAMQKYLLRALQGRLRESTDSIGAQYDPGNTQVNFTTASWSTTSTISTVDVNTTTNTTTATTVVNTLEDVTERSGQEIVGAF